MGSEVSSSLEEGEKSKSFLAPRSGRRPVRNLCSVQEALTDGLDEAALAEELEVDGGSDLAHGDEQVEKLELV